MGYFVGQSLAVVGAAFALGLVVGWLWWGRRWERVRVTESRLIGRLRRQHTLELDELASQIARLRAELVEAGRPVPEAAPEPRVVIDLRDGIPLARATTEDLDDLTRIEGIDVQAEQALRAAGLGTYEALADASYASLHAALAADRLPFSPGVVAWPRQARVLADARRKDSPSS